MLNKARLWLSLIGYTDFHGRKPAYIYELRVMPWLSGPKTSEMNNKIFINYRREDSSWSAGRIYDKLLLHFDKDQIFIDVDSIGFGDDFINYVENSINACDIFLAIIGPKWLEIMQRKSNEIDFVRLEIAAALKNNIKIIPLLLEDTKMPSFSDLPEEIKHLSRRNAFLLSHISFNNQIEKLAVTLKDLFSQKDIDLKRKEEEAERQREFEQEAKQKQAEEERQRQEQLNEEQFWKLVSTDNTYQSYQKYINTYPNGKYKDEAEKKTDALKLLNEEEIYWKKVSKESISSLNIYLENYPKGKYCDEANYKINLLSANEKLRLETIPEEKNHRKNLKRTFILFGFGGLLIISLTWFFVNLKKNSQPTITSNSDTTNAYRDSVYGKEIKKDNARLNYTKRVNVSDAQRVVNFMSLHGFDNSDSITHQLDKYNDTVLFKYNLHNKDEATPDVKRSMQEFGKLLSDSLFSDKPLKVIGYNIVEDLGYFSYVFNMNSLKKKDSVNNIISAKPNDLKLINSGVKNSQTSKRQPIDISGGYSDPEEDTIRIVPTVEQKKVEFKSNQPIGNKNEPEVKKNIITLTTKVTFTGDLYIDNKYFDRIDFTEKNITRKISVTQGLHVFLLRNISSVSSSKLIKDSHITYDIKVSKDFTITFIVDTKIWDANNEHWGKGIALSY